MQTATSLMNDISYCREICWDLVEAGSVLFSASDADEMAAIRSVALGEEESTLAEVIEPFLIQSGFLIHTRQGRQATPQAHRRFNYTGPVDANDQLGLFKE